MTYAEVILPLAVGTNLTYKVPPEMEKRVGVGFRVIVPLGNRNKFYTGIVKSLSTIKPAGNFDLKEIADIPDDSPIVVHPQLKMWEWIAEYYLCNEGDVYKAAVPSGLKIESETFVESNSDYEPSGTLPLSERETTALSFLEAKGKLSVDELQKVSGFKNIGSIVTSLIEKGAIMVSEKLQERYHTKKETYVKIDFDMSAENVDRLYTLVKGAPRQEKLLIFLINHFNNSRKQGTDADLSRKDVISGSDTSSSILDALIKKGILQQYKKEISRFRYTGHKLNPLPVLTEQQHEAFLKIDESFSSNHVTLFRGVTSSGKTEIYQHLISDCLIRGHQVLMLVPEIALTTQLTKRMQSVFGDKVIIYHSKFSDADRIETWRSMIEKRQPVLIIGARSSVFLPFSNLKLVIVDEEHESSYKQIDPTPRYNARDVAIVLASMHGAKTLLGSATPSIESYWKALNGKYGLVELLQRYNNAPLPHIELVDLTKSYKTKSMAGGFDLKTLKYIKESFDEGRQSIVFQNRRGFAPIARCKQCAWSPRCDQCDVSLTYHKNIDSLVCHYCGNIYQLPVECPQCHEPAIEIAGYGTERIEEEITLRMPEARLSRMDLDTTRNKDSYSKIIEEFSQHKSDILVGTQMVTKGLDFGDVSSVVVVNADSTINMPDFRASERAYNMLEQVAGRAGRRPENPGRVIIQTYDPSIELFKFLMAHDYRAFYDYEITERNKFHYPPFSRIINIYLKHRDQLTLSRIATSYASVLRQALGQRVFGPDEPLVARIQNLYIKRIMLKIETDTSLKRLKEYLKEVQVYMYANTPDMKRAVIYYDVDPF